MVTIRLDGAVKGKGRPRFNTHTGRAFTPDATRAYETSLRIEAQHAMRAAGLKPFDVPVSVRVVAEVAVPDGWPSWKREKALSGLLRPTTKPDGDNIIKMLDSFNKGVVWLDDTYAVEISFTKIYSGTPGLTVTVEPLRALPAQVARKSDAVLAAA